MVSPGAVLPTLPALVSGTVAHHRRGPLQHRFKHRVYQWLVDVDQLPRTTWFLRPFASFRAADHIGDPHRSLRENIERFCATQGLDVTGQRIVMLANARVLGHVFDPLSVFWVLADDGSLTCIVAEVHNTYGERHAYFLRPDADGRTQTDKAFYVSPFYEVDGQYDLRFELSPERVASTIVLRRGGAPVFGASFEGAPRPATTGRITRTVVSQPLMTQRTSLLIRVHGIWLWLRRLPLVPRPPHEPQEGTS